MHQDIKVAAVYSTFLLPKLNNQTYTLCFNTLLTPSIINFSILTTIQFHVHIWFCYSFPVKSKPALLLFLQHNLMYQTMIILHTIPYLVIICHHFFSANCIIQLKVTFSNCIHSSVQHLDYKCLSTVGSLLIVDLYLSVFF